MGKKRCGDKKFSKKSNNASTVLQTNDDIFLDCDNSATSIRAIDFKALYFEQVSENVKLMKQLEKEQASNIKLKEILEENKKRNKKVVKFWIDYALEKRYVFMELLKSYLESDPYGETLPICWKILDNYKLEDEANFFSPFFNVTKSYNAVFSNGHRLLTDDKEDVQTNERCHCLKQTEDVQSPIYGDARNSTEANVDDPVEEETEKDIKYIDQSSNCSSASATSSNKRSKCSFSRFNTNTQIYFKVDSQIRIDLLGASETFREKSFYLVEKDLKKILDEETNKDDTE